MELPSRRQVRKVARKAKKTIVKTAKAVHASAEAKLHRARRATRADRRHLARDLKRAGDDTGKLLVHAAKA